MPESLINVNEVVRRIGISRPTVYRMIKRGEFPKAIRVGASSKWATSEIDRYIEERKSARA